MILLENIIINYSVKYIYKIHIIFKYQTSTTKIFIKNPTTLHLTFYKTL